MNFTQMYFAVLRRIAGHLRCHLSPAEVDVLMFLNERTLRFGKLSEHVPMRHFLKGVTSSTGETIVCRCPYSERTIRGAIDGLLSRKIIIKQPGEYPIGTKCNKFAIDFTLLMEEEMNHLKVGKKHQQGVRPQQERGAATAVEGCGESSRKHKESKKGKIKEQNEVSLRDAVEEATTKNRQRRKRKASNANVPKPSVVNVTAAWTDKVVEHYGKCPTPHITLKEAGILKKAIDANKLHIPLTEFVDWVVSNWGNFKKGEMKWAKNMPDYPSLTYFGRMYRHFVKALADEEAGHISFVKSLKKTQTEEQQTIRELKRSLSEANAMLREQQNNPFRLPVVNHKTSKRKKRDRSQDVVDLADATFEMEDIPEFE